MEKEEVYTENEKTREGGERGRVNSRVKHYYKQLLPVLL